MKKKLTLSIDKETKQSVEKHVRAVGKSISEMAEIFLNEKCGLVFRMPIPGIMTPS